MGFNPENKITYNELAPSLQELLDSKGNASDVNSLRQKVDKVYANLGTVRVTISQDPGTVPIPKNDKEIHLNTSDRCVYGYNNGWYKCGGVYS